MALEGDSGVVVPVGDAPANERRSIEIHGTLVGLHVLEVGEPIVDVLKDEGLVCRPGEIGRNRSVGGLGRRRFLPRWRDQGVGKRFGPYGYAKEGNENKEKKAPHRVISCQVLLGRSGCA